MFLANSSRIRPVNGHQGLRGPPGTDRRSVDYRPGKLNAPVIVLVDACHELALECLAADTVQVCERDLPRFPIPLVQDGAVDPGDARQNAPVANAGRLDKLTDLQRAAGDVGAVDASRRPRPLPAWRPRLGCGRCADRSSRFPALSPSTASRGRS